MLDNRTHGLNDCIWPQGDTQPGIVLRHPVASGGCAERRTEDAHSAFPAATAPSVQVYVYIWLETILV